MEKEGFAGIQRTIREQEPPNPGARLTGLGEEGKRIAERRQTHVDALAKRLHRELEWIPLKAMRKERVRRYRSVSELSDDIQNYLDGAPLIAGPETAVYRVKKFVHKHAGSVATVAIIALAIILGLVISTAMYVKAEKALQREAKARVRAEEAEAIAREQRDVAKQAKELAQERAEAYRRAIYTNNLAMAKDAINEASIGRAQKLLDSCESELRGWEWRRLKYISSDESTMTLSGHSRSVNSVAVSPDGQRIASGGEDRIIKIWNTTTGSQVTTLTGHNASIESVAFSPKGKLIASGGYDRTIRIWDTTSGAEVKVLRGHEGWIGSIAYGPDGRRIASSGGDETVRVWDTTSGTEVMTLNGHKDDIWGVAFSPDGGLIASGSDDKTIKLWDATTGSDTRTLTGHDAEVYAVAFSPNGDCIASASADKTVRIWDTTTGDEKMILSGHRDGVESVAFSPDGNKIISCSDDRTIKVWNSVTGELLNTLHGHAREIYAVAFSPDGGRVFSSGDDDTIKVWDPVVDRDVLRLRGTQYGIDQVAFSPDGRYVAASLSDKAIKLWDAASGAEVTTLRGHFGDITALAFSPDGDQVVSGGDDWTVRIWDTVTGAMKRILTGHKGRVHSVAFSPEGRYVVSSGHDRMIRIWDAAMGSMRMTIDGYEGCALCLTISPDGRRIVSGGNDGTVRVWEVSSGKELLTLHGHKLWPVSEVSVSPDGKLIASCGEDKTVRVWDAVTGEEMMTLHGHDSYAHTVAFSPDGKRIVSGDYNREVKIWDADTGAELMNLYGDSLYIRSAMFSPDGKTICVGGYNGDITLWESDESAVGYERRDIANSARKLVDKLYKEHDLYDKVISKVADDSTVNDSVRKLVIQIAKARLWEDAEKLRDQAWNIAISPDHNEMEYREALAKAEKAVSIEPDILYNNHALGAAQYRVGAYEDALATIDRTENNPIVRRLGQGAGPIMTGFKSMALFKLGRNEEAEAVIRRIHDMYGQRAWEGQRLALMVEIEELFARNDAALLSLWKLIKSAQLDEAWEVMEKLRLSRDDDYANRMEGARKLLSSYYCRRAQDRWIEKGDFAGTIADYETAVSVDPNNAQVCAELAWIYTVCPASEWRDGRKAVETATRACELADWKDHGYIATLAAAYSEAGDYSSAVRWQKKAIDATLKDKRIELQTEREERLRLYESGKPYHEGARWSFTAGELVAWWRFDENKDGKAVDSSSHGLHGTLVGDAEIVADSERGNVLQVQGNGFVDCGNDAAFNITGAITVSAWAKLNKSSIPLQAIVSKGRNAWSLHRRPVDLTKFLCNCSHVEDNNFTISRGNPGGALGNPDFHDGKWHHLTGVYDGKRIYLYVDGEVNASQGALGNISTFDDLVCIGSAPGIKGGEWNGLIDDVRIYSYALSPDEVKMLYEGKEPPQKKGL